MPNLVVSTFDTRDKAEQAVNELRQKGFDNEISIVAKDEVARGHANRAGVQGRRDMEFGNDSVSDGATTGGVLGGLAGLAAGVGALAIPGLGPLFAAGPIAGLLSGAATGGIAGSLIDWGIPETESRQLEQDIRSGKIMVSVQSDPSKVNEAASILRKYGANSVNTH
ncbi:MAG: hypothetical protein GX755_09955 [Syntrophomonadaceae bacterium]|nr:hypothetical protein [Syntrophomonadaceae bacterium]